MIKEKTLSLRDNKNEFTPTPFLKPLFKKLEGLKHGRLSVIFPNQDCHTFGTSSDGLHATVILKSYKPVRRFLIDGDLGFAETYMEGEWECPDLGALFKLALVNEKAFELTNQGGFVQRTLNRFRHLLNANSLRGSKRNISYHYDLGNDFYAEWLDPSMTYSSALYESAEDSLENAQARKYHKIAQMAGLEAGDKVLEIGCGWGGFSEVAARDYGCDVTGLTLSEEQLAYANRRYEKLGLSRQARARLCDYRAIEGQFDRIVSIEMFEAVGEENWDTYFKVLKDRLKPGGTALLQIILIEDKRFETYRKGVDFIQKYIFPGGLLPSSQALQKRFKDHGFIHDDSFHFGASYARTCEVWQRAFQHGWNDIRKMGFDDRFKRMWEYYLSYCEAGFDIGTIDVALFKLTKPA